jgi:hypothetical protein
MHTVQGDISLMKALCKCDMAQEKEGMFQLLKVEKNGFLQLHRIYMLITVHISHQKPWLLNPL